MALTVEQYAEYLAPAGVLWSIIGDPHRLPAWTDASRVEFASHAGKVSQWFEGLNVTVHGRSSTTWRVISAGQRVVEVSGMTSCGQLGLGARVIEIPSSHGPPGAQGRFQGARLVLVARLEPSRSVLRARVLDLPAIRRRFDRWSTALRNLTEYS